MAVSITRVKDYGGLGAALHITNGLVEAYATIDRGPRIIHFALVDGPNLFWVDNDGSGLCAQPGLHQAFGRGPVYAITGGHRLWVSPEHEVNSYYPDIDKVKVHRTARGFLLTPPAQEKLDLQLSIDFKMSPDRPSVTVRHMIQNTARRPIRMAAWAITQLSQGGMLVFPQSKKDTGLLPDRQFSVWPYTDMGDARLCFADEYVSVVQDPRLARALKIGAYNRHGRALFLNRGAVFVKTWAPVEGAPYPDGGCCFETYTDGRFIEMESLSPLCHVAPGEAVTHEETWELFPEKGGLDAAALWDRYGR